MPFTMLRRRRRIAVVVALAAAIALTLPVLTMLGARGPAVAHAAVKHATHHAATARDPDTLQVGDQTSPDSVRGAERTGTVGDPAGNSQAGGPDKSTVNDPAGNSQAGGSDKGSPSGDEQIQHLPSADGTRTVAATHFGRGGDTRAAGNSRRAGHQRVRLTVDGAVSSVGGGLPLSNDEPEGAWR